MCEFSVAYGQRDYLLALDQFHPDIILSDHSLPQFDSRDALISSPRAVSRNSVYYGNRNCIGRVCRNVMKSGADDYILKDRLARLPAAVEAAIKQRRVLKEIEDYKYALDQSAIVAITDQKGVIQYANDNFCRISKYATHELIGQDHRIINSGYHPKSYIRELWVTIANGKIWRGEFCNKAKDGNLYWVETTIIPFLNENRKPYQYLAIRIDITKKKKAEEKIKRSEINLRTIFENTSEGFLLMDRNAVIIAFNSKALNILFLASRKNSGLANPFLILLKKSRRRIFPGNCLKSIKRGKYSI